MEVAFSSLPLSIETRMLSCTSTHSQSRRSISRRPSNPCPKFSPRAFLNTSFVAPFVGGSVSGDLTGQKLRVLSLRPSLCGRRGSRGVVTMLTTCGCSKLCCGLK